MLGDQSLLDDADGLTTDRTNKVRLLRKGAIPQLNGLVPTVFGYGIVIVAFDRKRTCLRFRFLTHWAYGLTCRALPRNCQLYQGKHLEF